MGQRVGGCRVQRWLGPRQGEGGEDESQDRVGGQGGWGLGRRGLMLA